MSLYYKTDTAVVCVWVNKQVNPQCVCVCKWVHCGKRSDSFRTVLVVLLDYRLYIFITIVIILKILIQSCLQVYEWSGYLQFNYIIHVLGFTSFYLVQSVAGFLFVFDFPFLKIFLLGSLSTHNQINAIMLLFLLFSCSKSDSLQKLVCTSS